MAKPHIRCAVYTRKSSEEGLEQAFNSLHAQREACEAYILSQRHEGWSLIPTAYDDGGFSGGSMERPALKALLADIQAGDVDVVVVYKIDRLTRSLFDFAKMVEIFDGKKTSFVSVTQSFNTTTSMGRLTLNVLLSFAQFEREVTGERIRDKFAASKRKGMWMGGNVPLGYAVKDRKLVIVPQEADTVRTIFKIYTEHKSVSWTKAQLDKLELTTKRHMPASGITRGGLPFRTGHLYTILRNPLYRGLVHHKDQTFDGDHDAIIDQDLWERTQTILAANAVTRRAGSDAAEPSLLAGRLFDSGGNRLTPTHATKQGRRYRYYVSKCLIDQGRGKHPDADRAIRLPAQEIELHVVEAIVAFLTDPQRLTAEFEGGTAEGIGALVRRGSTVAKSLRADDGHQRVRALLQRVEVSEKDLNIALDRDALAGALNLPSDRGGTESSVQLRVPVALRRLGGERRMIVTSGIDRSNPDPVLIKVVVRAHKWFDMLKAHAVTSISQLAEIEKLPRTYVGSIVPLALLAPDITTAILYGRQPLGLTLERLIAQPLPIAWSEQRTLLGWVGSPSSSE